MNFFRLAALLLLFFFFTSQTNATWLRYAQHVDKFLVRASMPFTTYPVALTVKESDSGDFKIFAGFNMQFIK